MVNLLLAAERVAKRRGRLVVANGGHRHARRSQLGSVRLALVAQQCSIAKVDLPESAHDHRRVLAVIACLEAAGRQPTG
jgi:hypothetical protein